MKIEIIPAILPKDYAEVEEKTSLVKGLVKLVQIDVCDGQFTPQATWPYKKEDDSFEKILKEEDGLPGWEKLDFEIDLMVNSPEKVIEDWVMAGATRIVIHAESRGSVLDAVDNLVDRVEIGIALNIDTPVEALEPYANKIQFVQCMGIDQIGFQGQEFDERVIEKVREVKEMYPDLLVSIDGGVTLETGAQLVEAGADRLIVGSAIFGSDNFTEAIQKFKALGR
ncbi:MAG: hypothetical protein V4481_02120 [Patescibacteria group bacterium]